MFLQMYEEEGVSGAFYWFDLLLAISLGELVKP